MTRHVTRAGILDTVPFLYSEEQAKEIIDGYPEHERKARAYGIPQPGSGLIFPIDRKEIEIDPFPIPDHWACLGAMDFGYDHPFAAVKLVHDRDADCVYVTNTYKKREATPLIHSGALKPWGDGMQWAWPMDGWDQSGKHGTRPGVAYKDSYRSHGLNMLEDHAQFEDGSNGVEAGLMRILERMQTDRWKVFSTCLDWFDEQVLYHRKEGKIVKEFDDLMDASRYGEMCIRFASPLVATVLPRAKRRGIA